MSPALIWSFARQELVDRYAGSALGFTWAFVQPLVLLFIFVVIFGQLMSARLPGVDSAWGYSVYLISGMLPWLAFSNTLSRTATVFIDKKHIITKVGLSLPTLPVFIVLAETLTFLIGFGFVLLLLFALDIPLRSHLLVLPWVFMVQQLFALGLGMILAVLNVFLRDIREFTSVLVQLWFWVTPIVWVPDAVPAIIYRTLSVINPLVPLTEAWHAMFLGERSPDYLFVAAVAVLACLLLGTGYLMVKKLEKDIRDFL